MASSKICMEIFVKVLDRPKIGNANSQLNVLQILSSTFVNKQNKIKILKISDFHEIFHFKNQFEFETVSI